MLHLITDASLRTNEPKDHFIAAVSATPVFWDDLKRDDHTVYGILSGQRAWIRALDDQRLFHFGFGSDTFRKSVIRPTHRQRCAGVPIGWGSGTWLCDGRGVAFAGTSALDGIDIERGWVRRQFKCSVDHVQSWRQSCRTPRY